MAIDRSGSFGELRVVQLSLVLGSKLGLHSWTCNIFGMLFTCLYIAESWKNYRYSWG